MHIKRAVFLPLLALGLLFAQAGQAAQFKTFGDYVVHYNALSTEMLTPEVAKANNIMRSKNRALLNISVRKKAGESELTDHAVAAEVKASAVNLSRQLKDVKMQEVREGGAIYYLGVFTITDKETFDFTITVKPEFNGEPYTFQFQQQFFVN